MQKHRQVDVVSHDPAVDRVVLSMVETRGWGDRGANLPDVQKKIYAYLDYVESGEIWVGYPEFKGKKIGFRLHAQFPPTKLEEDFLSLVKKTYLDPLEISWATTPLSSE